ncbi:dynamin family protein, partial [Paenibacillus pinistramenti]|uniref:dynamin family protein n=1 Tax=Paenibacillus pinistramenti TaxID=1768003 RepID=UPI001939C2E6
PPGPGGGGPRAPRRLRRRALEAAARLEAAAGLLAPHPAFGTGVEELRKRAAELRRGRFTVALFGAFSAGKSSFANALLGEPVLPVSPHPTTAAIGRILAPEDGFEHATANIQFKTLQAMEEDLAFSFSALQLGDWKPSSWLDTVNKLKAGQIPAAGRAHFSFLKAAAAGWQDMAPNLGSSKITGLEEFRNYVAEETKACFVASIDLYFSCPLTEQGIVLVDTPGADSIHARHTGVTFQYMKNSDAILFVTYYNHAFSRADKQFLSQLGRIKGSFALDKMFFIVNAADLAASGEELDQVVEHVRDGLRGAGISEPNIFALSSHQALKENKGGTALFADTVNGVNSEEALEAAGGFSRFASRFSSFLEEDLSRLAAAAAAAELIQLKDRLSKWNETAEQFLSDRDAQLEALQQERVNFEQAVTGLKEADIRAEWTQECEELLFHVIQRLRLQALDLFSEFFHPSLLQEGQGELKHHFAIAMRGWLDQTSSELERELLATSLRLERKGEALLLREAASWCRSHSEGFDMPLTAPAALADWESAAIPEGLLRSEGITPAAYWSYFKNPKHFFEGSGRSALREALEKPLVERLKEAVSRGEELFKAHYLQAVKDKQEEIAQHFLELWMEWQESIQNSGVSAEDLQQWKFTAVQLGRYCEEMEAFYEV